MKEEAGNGQGWSCNWGIDFSKVSRRGFLKTSAAAASLATLLPGCGSDKEDQTQEESTTVFTGGTVMTRIH